jgi:hypothetical protein
MRTCVPSSAGVNVIGGRFYMRDAPCFPRVDSCPSMHPGLRVPCRGREGFTGPGQTDRERIEADMLVTHSDVPACGAQIA